MAPRSFDYPLLLLLSAAVLLSCCCGLYGAARPEPSSGITANTSFVRAWCAGTEYPALCDATLFPYAAAVGTSPARLAWAALNVTFAGARDAREAMKEMAAGGNLTPVATEAAGDCVSMLGDAVGMLRQSAEAMAAQAEEDDQQQQASSRTARFRVDSVRTWASAALTDDGMCMEGFKGEPAAVREAVRGHVVGLAHLTANALCIVNAMAAQTPP
jgi:pectinesterase inhibitor-like protein